MSTCLCKECCKFKQECDRVLNDTTRELVWLISRFARASPLKERIPREFDSYASISYVLYHSFHYQPELYSDLVLKFLYNMSQKPKFSTRFTESWKIKTVKNHEVVFTIQFDVDCLEWIGTIDVPERMPFEYSIFQMDYKPLFAWGSKTFGNVLYLFFSSYMESNCYYVIKRILKEYENKINSSKI